MLHANTKLQAAHLKVCSSTCGSFIRFVLPINFLTCPNSLMPRSVPFQSGARIFVLFELRSSRSRSGAFANITWRPARGGTRAPQFVGISKRNQARQDKRFAVGPMHINFKPRKSKLLSVRPLSFLSVSLSLALALCFSMNVSFHLVHSVSLCLRTALSSIHLRPKTQNKAIRAIRSAKRGPIIFRSADFARKNGHAITN